MRPRHLFPVVLLLATSAVDAVAGLPTVRNYGQDEHFDPAEAVSGSSSTPEQCAQTHQALWVTVPGHADCLRYYFAGPLQDAPKAEVFLDGDELMSLHNGQVVAASDYGDASPRILERWATVWAERLQIPYVHLARPGTMGSSGNQNDRRQQTETLEVDAALDQLKALYRIGRFGLAGQSGGGGLVAALIAERTDVLCAVSSSGVVAITARNTIRHQHDVTGYTTFWDPIDQVGRVHQAADFRLFLVGDPEDANVPFQSLLQYAEAATQAGLHPVVIQGIGTGALHHGLARTGVPLTADCLHGVPTDTLVAKYDQSR